jgi:hypothetical protein
VRDQPGRIRNVVVDQVTQVSVVVLHVGLAGRDRLALEEELSEVEGQLSLLGEIVCDTGIFGNEDTDHTDASGRAHDLDQRVHRQVGCLMPSASCAW